MIGTPDFGGGRRRPYTSLGISRLMCCRAGCTRAAYSSWSACADENLQRPLCPECDVTLNRLALAWMGDPDGEEKVRVYVARVSAAVGRSLDLPWLT